MFLEGPNPPFVSDAGWAGRPAPQTNNNSVSDSETVGEDVDTNARKAVKGGGRRDRGGMGRRGKGGRGGKPAVEDHRKVISDVRPFTSLGSSHSKNVSYHSLLRRSKHARASMKLYESYLVANLTVRRA